MSIQNITLKTAPFQFGNLTLSQYQQPVADTGILRDSLTKIESRRREANATNDEYINKMNTIRNALDPSEYADFDKEFKNISNKIGELIDLGDSGEAIRLANTLGRDMAKDPKWMNKAKVKEQRDKWLQDAKAAGYSELTLRRMESENPYYDDGSGTFKHGTYHRVIPVADMLNIAVGKTSTRHTGTSSTRETTGPTFSKDGKLISNPLLDNNTLDPTAKLLYDSSSTISNSFNVTELNEKDLYNTFKKLSKTNEFNFSLRQVYTDNQWLYTEAERILNDPNASERDKKQAMQDKQSALAAIGDENGFIPADDINNEDVFNKWVDKFAKQYFKVVSYRHTDTGSTIRSGISYNIGKSSNSRSNSGSDSGNSSLLSSLYPSGGTTGSYYAGEGEDSSDDSGQPSAAPSAGMKDVKSN